MTSKDWKQEHSEMWEPEHFATCPDCKNRFFVSPFTEEGLYFDGQVLQLECPSCGLRDHKSPLGQ